MMLDSERDLLNRSKKFKSKFNVIIKYFKWIDLFTMKPVQLKLKLIYYKSTVTWIAGPDHILLVPGQSFLWSFVLFYSFLSDHRNSSIAPISRLKQSTNVSCIEPYGQAVQLIREESHRRLWLRLDRHVGPATCHHRPWRSIHPRLSAVGPTSDHLPTYQLPRGRLLLAVRKDDAAPWPPPLMSVSFPFALLPFYWQKKCLRNLKYHSKVT